MTEKELTWSEIRCWSNITREERQFCADLYNEISTDPLKFVEILNSCELNRISMPALAPDQFVDVGYEVAFYRDVSRVRSEIDDEEASSHRKFDLALFFKEQLIVIEAKAQQGYKAEDVEKIGIDKRILDGLLKGIDTYFVGICSDRYWNSNRRKREIDDCLNLVLTWKCLDQYYPKKNFERANSIYRN